MREILQTRGQARTDGPDAGAPQRLGGSARALLRTEGGDCRGLVGRLQGPVHACDGRALAHACRPAVGAVEEMVPRQLRALPPPPLGVVRYLLAAASAPAHPGSATHAHLLRVSQRDAKDIIRRENTIHKRSLSPQTLIDASSKQWCCACSKVRYEP